MANTFNLGNGNWAQKTGKLLAYNAENNNYKPLPFDFDRGSTATRVNRDGLIETVATDEPRIDFTNNTKGHLLLEPSRQNKVNYSEDFSQGYWVKDDVTLESASITDPSGGTGAYLMKGNTNSSRHNIRANSDTTTDSIISVFAKKKDLRYLQLGSAHSGNQYANFDLETGVIGAVGSDFSNVKIENYGNGWYRLSAKANSQNSDVYISLVSSSTAGWLETWSMDNATDGLYLWGAQHEEGSYTTSYIPTSGSAVTRAVDNCYINSGLQDTLNTSEGTLFVDVEVPRVSSSGSYERITLSDQNASTDRILFDNYGGNWRALMLSSAGNVNKTIVNVTANQRIKVAIAYSSTGLRISYDGNTATTTSGSYTPTTTLESFKFSNKDGGNKWQGKIHEVKYFDTALSDAELITLTQV